MKKRYFILLLVYILLWTGCKFDEQEEEICSNPPTAAFTSDVTSGDAPLTVNFVSNATGADSHLWIFGNGATSTSISPTYTFSTPATHPVMLIVTSNTGCMDTFTMNITVNSALPPIACFSFTEVNAGIAPYEVTFDANCSENAASFLWDFGHLDTISGQNYASMASNPNHPFGKPGSYDVKLTTKNSVNDSSTLIRRVIICGPNSNLVNDSCICNAGYEKDDAGLCTVETRGDFIGNYITEEQCSSSPLSTYQISIVAGNLINEVKINNFWDIFISPIVATFSGTTINITSQEPDFDGFIVEGSGSIDPNQTPMVLTLSYTVTDTHGGTSVIDVCTNSIFVKL